MVHNNLMTRITYYIHVLHNTLINLFLSNKIENKTLYTNYIFINNKMKNDFFFT